MSFLERTIAVTFITVKGLSILALLFILSSCIYSDSKGTKLCDFKREKWTKTFCSVLATVVWPLSQDTENNM